MSFNQARITELTIKYVSGELTQEEQAELNLFLDAATEPDNRRRFEQRIQQLKVRESLAAWSIAEKTEKDSWSDVPNPQRGAKIVQLFSPLRKRLTVAAAFLVIAVGAFLIYRQRVTSFPQKQVAVVPVKDLLPGGNKATLTLAGGQQILLDDAKTGILAQEGAIRVNKTNSGTLTYTPNELRGKSIKEELRFNMLTTPRSGTYMVVLPDQSKVWLNSASSLKYPASFDGQVDREVSLTGEAYFEVAKKAGQPFRVLVKGTTVEVLGTSFNINAYTDESAIRTTLLDGAVRVAYHTERALLKPGEQALLNQDDLFKIAQVDVNAAVAWKNGFFNFDHSDLQAVMRQISRWYDIEVVYNGIVPRRSFSGVIDRQLTLSQVLKILESNGVHFSIDGKKLNVTP